MSLVILNEEKFLRYFRSGD